MGIYPLLDDYKNKQLFTNTKIKKTTLRYNAKKLQGINPMGLCNPLCPLVQHLPKQLQTWRTWGTALNSINVLMSTGEITKAITLATAAHKPVVEANTYVWFGYIPPKICNHTKGQVSISMNFDTINRLHTSQQSTK